MSHGQDLEASAPPIFLHRSSDHKDRSQNQGVELRIGKCATCNSTVRWPRHLGVYRCTACLMINDLKSESGGNSDPARPSLPQQSDGPSTSQVRRKGQSCSLLNHLIILLTV